MRTTKPISTISYNSPQYLKERLEDLRKAGKIAFWTFVQHEPEDDESGLKRHIHLFIEPAKIVQTEDLKNEFNEIDPTSTKPLSVISFRASKFGDWYMYSKHDKAYLASKNEARKYHYAHEDFETSDNDDLLYRVRTINLLETSPYSAMLEAQRNGISWTEFAARGTIPLQQLRSAEYAWMLMERDRAERNGRHTHTPKEEDNDTNQEAPTIDKETGEVIENTPQDTPQDTPQEEPPQAPKKPSDNLKKYLKGLEAKRALKPPVSLNEYEKTHPNIKKRLEFTESPNETQVRVEEVE